MDQKDNMTKELPVIEEREGQVIVNPEIDRLEKPMEVILEKILPDIENGRYDLIIGIDASGRLPTLATNKFIKYIYQEKGYELPKTIFMAGAGMGWMGLEDNQISSALLLKKEKIREYLERFNSKKALIVEDTIVKGSSIKFLCEILAERKIPFDVISVSGLKDKEGLGEKARVLGAERIITGTKEGIGIYGSHHLGGVIKNEDDLFSRPAKYYSEGIEDEIKTQETINQARKDVDIVVSQLVDWYKSKESEK